MSFLLKIEKQYKMAMEPSVGPSSLVIRCCWCQSLDTNQTLKRSTDNGSQSICEKCQKNEEKYGQPKVCKYCGLNAAFVQQKCVHCAHSERKLGVPIICSACKRKCAFPKNDKYRETQGMVIHCRLCRPKGGHNQQSPKTKCKIKKSSMKKLKSKAEGIDGATSMEALNDQVVAMTHLKGQVFSLQAKLNDKDKLIFDRDKQIAVLNAQLLQLERETRQKLQTVQQQFTERESNLKNQINALNKQVSALTRGSASVR